MRYKKGDREAFSQLFNNFYPLLCAYAQTFVGGNDSEEVVQDFMVNFWINRDKIEIKTSLKNYLYQSIRNKCLTIVGQNSRKSRFSDLLEDEKQKFYDDVDSLLIQELKSKIAEIILNLPPTYREAFIKSRYDKKTYQEIATELGISVKTVDYRIQQALKILKKELSEYITLLLIYSLFQ